MATIRVTCTNAACQAQGSVAEELLGKKIQCTKCGTKFLAQPAPHGVASYPNSDAATQAAQSAPPPTSGALRNESVADASTTGNAGLSGTRTWPEYRRVLKTVARRTFYWLKVVPEYYFTHRSALWRRVSDHFPGLESATLHSREIRISADASIEPNRWDGEHGIVHFPRCCVVCGQHTDSDWIDERRAVVNLKWPTQAPLVAIGIGVLLSGYFWSPWCLVGSLLAGMALGYLRKRNADVQLRFRRCAEHTEVVTVPSARVFRDTLILQVGDWGVKIHFLPQQRENQEAAAAQHEQPLGLPSIPELDLPLADALEFEFQSREFLKKFIITLHRAGDSRFTIVKRRTGLLPFGCEEVTLSNPQLQVKCNYFEAKGAGLMRFGGIFWGIVFSASAFFFASGVQQLMILAVAATCFLMGLCVPFLRERYYALEMMGKSAGVLLYKGQSRDRLWTIAKQVRRFVGLAKTSEDSVQAKRPRLIRFVLYFLVVMLPTVFLSLSFHTRLPSLPSIGIARQSQERFHGRTTSQWLAVFRKIKRDPFKYKEWDFEMRAYRKPEEFIGFDPAAIEVLRDALSDPEVAEQARRILRR